MPMKAVTGLKCNYDINLSYLFCIKLVWSERGRSNTSPFYFQCSLVLMSFLAKSKWLTELNPDAYRGLLITVGMVQGHVPTSAAQLGRMTEPACPDRLNPEAYRGLLITGRMFSRSCPDKRSVAGSQDRTSPQSSWTPYSLLVSLSIYWFVRTWLFALWCEK